MNGADYVPEDDTANGDFGGDTGVTVRELPPPKKTVSRRGARVDSVTNSDVPSVLTPGPHWHLSDGRPEELLRLQVREVGCFYVRHVEGERYRCFNRLTGSEHISYGTVEEIDDNLERQTKIYKDKQDGKRTSPWRSDWVGKPQKSE